jgi:hypothetical protein
VSVLQVVGRKVPGLENPLRLDVVGFLDVTQESRDVARPVVREVLVALDGRATRGAGRAAVAAIIATGWATAIRFASRAANFTSAMVLDEGESQVFFAIVKGVEDRRDERELRENWSHHGQFERPECLPGQTCLCGRVRHQGGRRLPRCV